ncbi:hypothetical protein BD779DRAFT_280337 [Infundibulicybe gibba]|nr:hypothetical protein BD779DRAFT_280337 [Infundibulicybe gibba]
MYGGQKTKCSDTRVRRQCGWSNSSATTATPSRPRPVFRSQRPPLSKNTESSSLYTWSVHAARSAMNPRTVRWLRPSNPWCLPALPSASIAHLGAQKPNKHSHDHPVVSTRRQLQTMLVHDDRLLDFLLRGAVNFLERVAGIQDGYFHVVGYSIRP